MPPRYYDPARRRRPVLLRLPAVPYLKLAAVHDEKAGALTLFALNRSLHDILPLELHAAGFGKLGLKQAQQLCDPDLEAVNSRTEPDRVRPSVLSAVEVAGDRLEASLAPASWNVIQLSVG